MALDRFRRILKTPRWLLIAAAIFWSSSFAAQALVISEVMFNPVGFGSDDGLEWVELYNNGAGDILLDDYSLGWGGTDYTTGTLNLDGAGILASGAYIVIGGPASAFDFNPNLEDGYFTADAVGLFNVDASAIPGQTPNDALIYGTTLFGFDPVNNNNLIDSTGGVGVVNAIIGGAGDTAVRNADGSWSTSSTPTPGNGNAPVPDPSTALLLGVGLLLLAHRR
jgi:Lamin Tail Domain